MTLSIIVRHAEPSDYAACAAIYAQPRAAAGTMQIPLQSAEVWKQRLSNVTSNDRNLVALVNGEIVGNLSLWLETRPRRAHAGRIGMAVHDNWQGQGIGSALLRSAIDLADNWLNLFRLELTVYTDNTAGMRLYHGQGFVVEGTLRAYALRHGRYMDVHAMARLHPAPAAITV